jgi:hypothetical protein
VAQHVLFTGNTNKKFNLLVKDMALFMRLAEEAGNH